MESEPLHLDAHGDAAHILGPRPFMIARELTRGRRQPTTAPDRCTAAGVPPDTAFAIEPALATAIITAAALDAGTPASSVCPFPAPGSDRGRVQPPSPLIHNVKASQHASPAGPVGAVMPPRPVARAIVGK